MEQQAASVIPRLFAVCSRPYLRYRALTHFQCALVQLYLYISGSIVYMKDRCVSSILHLFSTIQLNLRQSFVSYFISNGGLIFLLLSIGVFVKYLKSACLFHLELKTR